MDACTAAASPGSALSVTTPCCLTPTMTSLPGDALCTAATRSVPGGAPSATGMALAACSKAAAPIASPEKAILSRRALCSRRREVPDGTSITVASAGKAAMTPSLRAGGVGSDISIVAWTSAYSERLPISSPEVAMIDKTLLADRSAASTFVVASMAIWVCGGGGGSEGGEGLLGFGVGAGGGSAVQMSCEVKDPPEHSNPGSTWQFRSHPSPIMTLLSSQPSFATRRPSPQIGAQESRPPNPMPVVLDEMDEMQPKPTSIMHCALQPSPLAVLLSSQRSSLAKSPSPQCSWVGASSLLARIGSFVISVTVPSILLSVRLLIDCCAKCRRSTSQVCIARELSASQARLSCQTSAEYSPVVVRRRVSLAPHLLVVLPAVVVLVVL